MTCLNSTTATRRKPGYKDRVTKWHGDFFIPHPFEEPGTGCFQKKRAVSKQHPGHCFPVAVFSLPLASRKMYTFEWIEDPINRGETEEHSKPTEFGLPQHKPTGYLLAVSWPLSAFETTMFSITRTSTRRFCCRASRV